MTINNGNYHFHYKTDIIEQKNKQNIYCKRRLLNNIHEI